jgi:hemolysin activation/secretion protein
VTVAVGIPQQAITNAEVKMKVTEGRLAAINVTGNRWFSSNNVMRALPSLHPDMLLNSHVFQRELDSANASRDRQIYPVIGPGPDPGTSELTLKVKDRLPWHARLELNNQATPGTPDMRANFSSQYDNLWNLEHQAGVQYSFAFQQFDSGPYNLTPLDDPLIANYSAYYRLPLGRASSVQEEVDASPSRFGFDELTHQFRLPPPANRPTLTVYASRSVSDTGTQFGTPTNIVHTPLLTIDSVDSGENITLNEGFGARLSVPLPPVTKLTGTVTFGFDFKRYRLTSNNTNNFPTGFVFTNQFGPYTNSQTVSSPQPTAHAAVDYLPLNVGLNTSLPDDWGTTFFNANVNFNPFTFLSGDKEFARAGYTTNTHANFVTVQAGVNREQKIYQEWSVLLHADGQWANNPLFSNEQFGMGGTTGVRGYSEGESYGDNGWRVMIEPRTPLINIGMADGDVPCWLRSSVFLDYGETSLLEQRASSVNHLRFMGTGWGLTASIGTHLDARLLVAFPLIATPTTRVGDVHVYFAVGAQF